MHVHGMLPRVRQEVPVVCDWISVTSVLLPVQCMWLHVKDFQGLLSTFHFHFQVSSC